MAQFVVLPVLRLAEQDQRLLAAVIRLVGRLRPVRVFLTGLLADAACVCASAELVSRCRPSGEVCERLRVAFLEPLRKVYGGGIGALGGAQLGGGPCDRVGEPLSSILDEAGVEPLPSRYGFAPGWLMLGRSCQACRTVGAVSGASALAIARAVGSSVIVGDTGRLGVGRLRVVGERGRSRLLVGAEAGSLINGRSVGDVVDRRRRSDAGLLLVSVDERGQVTVQCVGL